ncbi:DUF1471 family periplasmic protein YahO (plasmid) [Pantoea agglomerans pv. betae]|uniref:DUF1471 family periplasmic protein YahO n=1 Tax=Enterobacter agglomerans TaxID=549 RepID=UPI0007E56240|nr:DUF1471 family periplasmic protein YahO [Pantoea agglomerans]WHU82294.1 DUF1471 family periplasmic protein YahO [Pantoea agglomerans pv. betae]
MKKLIFGVVICSLSVGSFAAEMMSKNDFMKVKDQYEKIGDISTSGETSPSDAKAELSEMADKKGGDVFVLTSANTNNKIKGTADVYKKK